MGLQYFSREIEAGRSDRIVVGASNFLMLLEKQSTVENAGLKIRLDNFLESRLFPGVSFKTLDAFTQVELVNDGDVAVTASVYVGDGVVDVSTSVGTGTLGADLESIAKEELVPGENFLSATDAIAMDASAAASRVVYLNDDGDVLNLAGAAAYRETNPFILQTPEDGSTIYVYITGTTVVPPAAMVRMAGLELKPGGTLTLDDILLPAVYMARATGGVATGVRVFERAKVTRQYKYQLVAGK